MMTEFEPWSSVVVRSGHPADCSTTTTAQMVINFMTQIFFTVGVRLVVTIDIYEQIDCSLIQLASLVMWPTTTKIQPS